MAQYVIVRTKSGSETHLARAETVGYSLTVGHQLPSRRSQTYKVRAADVTCQKCRNTDAYQTWRKEQAQ